MKIVFLDLDGVMNSGWYYAYRRDDVLMKKDNKWFKEIDPKVIEILNDFCEETNANIVLSSTWKNVAYDEKVLEQCGFKGNVTGVTPSLAGKYTLRGNEIYAWIKDHAKELNVDYPADFKQYVIFDDDSDMLYWQRHHFFQTDFVSGLTRDIAHRAKRFLKSQVNL